MCVWLCLEAANFYWAYLTQSDQHRSRYGLIIHSFTEHFLFPFFSKNNNTKTRKNTRKMKPKPPNIRCQQPFAIIWRSTLSTYFSPYFLFSDLVHSSPASRTCQKTFFFFGRPGDVARLDNGVLSNSPFTTGNDSPASMLTLVSYHRWQRPSPLKSECATIHMQIHRRTETKRTRMILQLTNDIPVTQARCLVFFCQRFHFLNSHLMISILNLLSWGSPCPRFAINDLHHAFNSRFDSARAP